MNTQVRNAREIASAAAELVGGDRHRQHGEKHDNFRRIAALWDAWLDVRRLDAPLGAHDVGVMMVLMKMARTQSGAVNVDDYVDAAGYAACAGEVALLAEAAAMLDETEPELPWGSYRWKNASGEKDTGAEVDAADADTRPAVGDRFVYTGLSQVSHNLARIGKTGRITPDFDAVSVVVVWDDDVDLPRSVFWENVKRIDDFECVQ